MFRLLSLFLPLFLNANIIEDDFKGVYGVYDFDAPRVNAPAPKGYKVCYLSHFGRHGSRYLHGQHEYDTLAAVLHREQLTAYGQQLKERFDKYTPSMNGRAADLTDAGKQQHRMLARRMCEDFPELFTRKSSVYALVSDKTRCMMSMYNFLDELRKCRSYLDIEAEYNSSMLRCFWTRQRHSFPMSEYLDANYDPMPLFKKIFAEPSQAAAMTDAGFFAQTLYYYACHLEGAGFKDVFFDDLFTESELRALHEIDNEKFSYNRGPLYPENLAMACTSLSEIITSADKELAAGKPSVHLRFGHDNMMIGLMSLMGVPPFDQNRVECSQVTMAANMRLVFARNKAGDVQVKVQFNESDVMEWVPWNEFRAECLRKIELLPDQHSIFEKNSVYYPLFIAHRGLQSYGPENSFASFKAAAERHMWAIETDFRITSDGHVVCLHDKTLDRTTDGKELVAEKTLAEIKELNVLPVNTKTVRKLYDYAQLSDEDKKVPTMDEYLDICNRSGCVAFIELKEDKGIISSMIASIEKYGMQDRCVISSGNLALLEAYRAQGGKETIHLIFAKPEQIQRVKELGNASVSFKYSDLDAEVDLEIDGTRITSFKQLVDYIHSLGIRICFRAADTAEDARKMLEYGVDYMPSNVRYSID